MKINIPEFSVNEFSRAIKNVVEDAFGYIRIRGEISGFKKATSGHLYFNLKDDSASLTAVCFRNSAQNINFEVADGLEVCASGKITTFESRSNYQIVIDKIEIAGIGAILEMLEKRKQKLANEGLFDVKYKKPLPFFPKIIGVITSPTGAVIEDIKHRISARCPTSILLYEASVQGDKAVKEVCNGINYFNNLKTNRPELIIIARGGGSFEDLLPFSDEDLVRLAFKCDIPIISAIGHETDNCLLDLVADVRAPTPTASAEIATPILLDLKNQLLSLENNLKKNYQNFFSNNFKNLANLSRYIVSPENFLSNQNRKIVNSLQKIDLLINSEIKLKLTKVKTININQQLLLNNIKFNSERLKRNHLNIATQVQNYLKQVNNKIYSISLNLKNCDYQNILKKGFAIIKNSKNEVIDSSHKIKENDLIKISFYDGDVASIIKN